MIAWTDLYPDGTTPRSSERFNPDPLEAHALVTAPIATGERVLEVGCSTGYITEHLTKVRGCTVVGLETNKVAAAMTRARAGVLVFEPTGDTPELPSEYTQYFDVVLCADVIEHVSHPARFLRDLLRYLKPSGRVMISTPNVAHWTCRALLLRGRFEYEAQGILAADHLRFFTQDSLLRLLREVGLEPQSLRYSAGGWLPQYSHPLLRPLRRPSVLKGLVDRWPTLFGVQFIVEATRA